ncbi:MAG TPA: glycyl-radical enzyme activating protein [Longimicrobiales bacterium]|nr:glycyl-radical enzyme activating protein [Longimicrobiales bacterium]
MTLGLVFNVQRYSVQDGPGIRTTVFLKGCPLRCWWCHNPESQDPGPFVHYDPARCLRCGECVDACPRGALSLTGAGVVTDPGRCDRTGTCAEACPAEARTLVGRSASAGDLVDEVESDRLYFEQSGGGVTFSGGEPLLQWRFLAEALAECGKREIHRAVDTSGFAPPEILLEVARETDLFLYDLKCMDPALHRQVTGVPLEPILDNLVRLGEAGSRVEVRIPLVPGITTDAHIERSAEFLAPLPGIQGVRLLPFHRSAREKHRRFALPWLMVRDDEIPGPTVERWADAFRRRGMRVHEE